MSNDSDSGLTDEIIKNHYQLDKFMKIYNQKRNENSGGNLVMYPQED